MADTEQEKDKLPRPAAPASRAKSGLPSSLTYHYTKFRSQLELRFVRELDERQFRWFYEPERLGDGRYLVDFYLPECKCWVEVKGVVDSRDHLVLREVAELLRVERKHRLYMYMDKSAFVVYPEGFKPISHEDFWAALAKHKLEHNPSNETKPKT